MNLEYHDNHDATAPADFLRRNQVTPRELVDEAIARIEATDSLVNALGQRLFDEAMRYVDGPLPDGPFRGVMHAVPGFDVDAECVRAVTYPRPGCAGAGGPVGRGVAGVGPHRDHGR